MHLSPATFRYSGSDAALQPVPTWARFFARLGEELAALERENRTTVVGITVPARPFAASFIAAGYILERNSRAPSQPSDEDAHFELLRANAHGAAVTFIKGNKLHRGRLVGVEEKDGVERVLLEGARGVTYQYTKSMARAVRLAEASVVQADPSARTVKVPKLVSAVLPPAQAMNFMTESRIDCVLVGTRSSLAGDLTSAEFGTATTRSTHGPLQDLVRVRGLAGASTGYRAEIVAASADKPDDAVAQADPRLVIYDAGRGFLRFGERWRGAHKVVLIDRGAPSAESVAEQLGNLFVERLKQTEVPGGEIPAALEAVGFELAA